MLIGGNRKCSICMSLLANILKDRWKLYSLNMNVLDGFSQNAFGCRLGTTMVNNILHGE